MKFLTVVFAFLLLCLILSLDEAYAGGPLIAVIDTGADLNHPDLKNNLWQNPGEIPGNGIDDDGNGYIDDVSGWNFARNNSDLDDHHGHGTHIAGLISTRSSSSKLMILKYYDPRASGVDNLKALIQALRYAAKMKAKIINYSGGGTFANSLEKQALEEAERNKILVVAAAGNESSDSDLVPFYPADYPLSNILSVAALDSNSRLLPSSNYGLRSVDIAAPGDSLRSSLPARNWGPMTGTSQATAVVTAAAALLMAQRPDLTDPSQIIAQLRSSARYQQALAGKIKSHGALDVSRLLTLRERGRSFSGYRIQGPDLEQGLRRPAARRD